MFPITDEILDMFPHTGDIHSGVPGHVETVCHGDQYTRMHSLETPYDASLIKLIEKLMHRENGNLWRIYYNCIS